MKPLERMLLIITVIMSLLVVLAVFYKKDQRLVQAPPQQEQVNPQNPESEPIQEPDIKPKTIAEARETITADELREKVEWLSDPKREGRMSGQKGNKDAAAYIKHYFQRCCSLVAEYQQLPVRKLNPNPKGESADNFTNNIVADWPGTTPRVIVIGGHMDHIGWGPQLSLDNKVGIHPGADDNASGAASVMQLAQAFCLMKPRQHTIRFIAFSGEELGLVGSKYYVNHLEDKGKIDLMVNLDMVGYLFSKDQLKVTGIKRIHELTSICQQLNGRYSFSVVAGGGDSGGSDHASFGNAGIPYAFFITGLHDNYHRVTDTPDRLDYEGHAKVTKFVFDMVCQFDKKKLIRTATITYPTMKDWVPPEQLGQEVPDQQEPHAAIYSR